MIDEPEHAPAPVDVALARDKPERGRRLLVFGGTGAVGSALIRRAVDHGWDIVGTLREGSAARPDDTARWRLYDPLVHRAGDALDGEAPFDAVCWAQGANIADSIMGFDSAAHLDLYRANVLLILQSASDLVAAGLLSSAGARLVVVSSIWQERARADKLSYTITKAALGGLVRSLSVDLAAAGHLVNAVLPGVLDTPMTRCNLSPAQIEAIAGMTPHHRLPDLATLAATILFLCSAANAAINGQSIAVDLGMSNAIAI